MLFLEEKNITSKMFLKDKNITQLMLFFGRWQYYFKIFSENKKMHTVFEIFKYWSIKSCNEN